jgi:gas vesicle protein
MEYVVAFLAGAVVGACVGSVVLGLLVATREEIKRYR